MEIADALLALGGLFAVGMATDAIARWRQLPRGTLLIVAGVAAGPVGFDLVPAGLGGWNGPLSTVALTAVAFLLGGALSRDQIRRHGREIVAISLAVVGVTLVTVAGGLIALGVDLPLALLLAGIATTTAPIAVRDVIRQTGAAGDFTDTIRGIVAVDDAWGLIAFSLVLIAAGTMAGGGLQPALESGLADFGGAVATGVAVGVPAAFLTGRVRPGEPSQAEAFAVVFLCAGLSAKLGVSPIVAGVVAGVIVVNFARHHRRPFHQIERIEWPLMILFFFLAGVALEMPQGAAFAALVAGYTVLRTAGHLAGGWAVARLGAAPANERWIGMALLPQAGAAVGMALVAGNSLPEYRETLLAVTIATTILFEMFGPYLTLVALRRTGETRQARAAQRLREKLDGKQGGKEGGSDGSPGGGSEPPAS